MTHPTDVKALARLALDTLKAQRRYWDEGRTREALIHSKDYERKLRAACERILDDQPKLFG